jgi:hypothetical protein
MTQIRKLLTVVAVAMPGLSIVPVQAQTSPAAPAASSSANPNPFVAQIKVSRGVVRIERAGQKFPAPVGARIKVDDTVLTGGNGEAGLTFADNSTMSMGPESEVLLQRFNYDPTTYMGAFDAYVKQGTVALQAGNLAQSGADNLHVTTPKSELKGNAKQLLISVGDGK